MLVTRLNAETDDDAMNDALFVMITYFLPYDPIQTRMQQVTNETQWSDATR